MRAMATKPTSALRSLKTGAAFVHRAPILFRDVDAAGAAYYPRLIDLCHCAFEAFFNHRIGPAYARVIASGIGFPTVHFEADFVKTLRHGDTVDITVTVSRVGETSIGLEYEARRGRNIVFTARNVVVVVDIVTMTKKVLDRRLRARFTSQMKPAGTRN